MLLLPNQLRIKKHIPVGTHPSTNRGIEQHSIGLALIKFTENQSLVFQAVVFNVRTRNNVINFVIATGKLVDIDGFPRIQALATLHKIQGQPLV